MSVNNKDVDRQRLTHITAANEMNEMSVEKWCNEICYGGKLENPQENLPTPRFVYHETHMELAETRTREPQQ